MTKECSERFAVRVSKHRNSFGNSEAQMAIDVPAGHNSPGIPGSAQCPCIVVDLLLLLCILFLHTEQMHVPSEILQHFLKLENSLQFK